ncbi:MAG: TerB N-terminal domain-containing protein [Clostridiales bacterium]|jgi:hypothetical protein|nr:TerB N-terminal domain-containing protein [Clostridiales bacterium]
MQYIILIVIAIFLFATPVGWFILACIIIGVIIACIVKKTTVNTAFDNTNVNESNNLNTIQPVSNPKEGEIMQSGLENLSVQLDYAPNTNKKTQSDFEFHLVEQTINKRQELNFTNSIYTPEKLSISEPTDTNYNTPTPYEKFKQMRTLIHNIYNGYYSFSYYAADSEGFVKQAKFMEKFEDNYKDIKDFEQYSPTYANMDDAQLRTYFTWRTKVRNGNVENVSLSYAYVYIYELINNIGVSKNEDGLEKLINFWVEFRKYNAHLDRYLPSWCMDYFVVYNDNLENDFSYYANLFPIAFTSKKEMIDQMKDGKWSLDFIETASSHKISKTAFYKPEYEEIINQCVPFVLNNLKTYFQQNNWNLYNLFFEIYDNNYYHPFRSAVWKEIYYTTDKIVKLNDYEVYKSVSGSWQCKDVNVWKFRETKGYILKYIEIFMRLKIGVSQRLKEPEVARIIGEFILYNRSWKVAPAWHKEIFEKFKSGEIKTEIRNAVGKFFFENKIVINNEGEIKKVKPIDIDISALSKIREEHKEIAEKLNTDIESNRAEIIAKPIIEIAPASNGWDGFFHALSAEEMELMQLLLNSHDLSNFKDLELTLESINEKALDFIEDNIIEIVAEDPYIYDEYFEKTANVIGGQVHG